MINAAQIRAARALLDWNRDQLGASSGVSVPALSKIETEKSNPHPETIVKVQTALEQAGCVFTDNSGVKLKSEIVTVYEGREGLKNFFDDLYITGQHFGGEFLISGGNQKDFHDAMGAEFLSFHAKRMQTLKNFKIKALKPVSRMDEPGLDYIEFHYIPDQMFFTVPFYVYHDKLAIIIWDPVRIIVLHDQRVADAYRLQFNTIWKLGKSADHNRHIEV